MSGELRRILMVDDDIDIQLVARVTLEDMAGFDLLVCGDGDEALKRLPDFAPDLVLLDAVLPGRDGPEIFADLSRLPHMADTPVVFITARSEPEEIDALRSLGALDVITKPFDPVALPDTLRALWQRHLTAGAASPAEG